MTNPLFTGEGTIKKRAVILKVTNWAAEPAKADVRQSLLKHRDQHGFGDEN